MLFKFDVKINPNSLEAHNGYGDILMQHGLSEEAKKQFATALSIDPDNAFAQDKISSID